jgi:NAD(P)H-hydrate epimerase
MVKAISQKDELLPLLDNDHVIAVGPGLGGDDWSNTLLSACLEVDATLVIDADGLNLLARRGYEKLAGRRHWILTPHPAEAARLLACDIPEIQADRVHSAQKIASQYGATVVLKGCGTVVADAGGAYAICPLGNPGMATAGSGDVLTGVIAALLGQGLSCFDAARAGVVAHAQAGDLAADKLGELALVAGDIIDHLPAVWGEIRP